MAGPRSSTASFGSDVQDSMVGGFFNSDEEEAETRLPTQSPGITSAINPGWFNDDDDKAKTD